MARAYYRWRLQRAVRGSVWVILVGVIWLLNALRILSWSHSWPLFLIAGGVMLFFKRTFIPATGMATSASGRNTAARGCR